MNLYTYRPLILILIILCGFQLLCSAQKESAPATHFVCIEAPNQASNKPALKSIVAGTKLWDLGKRIKVRFLNGSPTMQDTVKYFANQWAQYGNFEFKFIEQGNADIRISFDANGLVSYSYIGTNARYAPQFRPTMVLTLNDSSSIEDMSRIILHEFGHALGLLHEHQHPENTIQWDSQYVYNYFAQVGWSVALIDYYVLSNFNSSITPYCDYDPASVMHYPIPQSFTLDSFAIGNNTTLSKEDTLFLQQLYPFDTIRNLDSLCIRPIDTLVLVDTLNAPKDSLTADYSQPIQLQSLTNKVMLAANRPNPFTNTTVLPFYLEQHHRVQVEIFYSNGQRIYLLNQEFEAGFHQLTLDGTIFPSKGVYLYRFSTKDQLVTGRMMKF